MLHRAVQSMRTAVLTVHWTRARLRTGAYRCMPLSATLRAPALCSVALRIFTCAPPPSTQNTAQPLSHATSVKPKLSTGSALTSQNTTAESPAWKGNQAVWHVQVGPDGRTPIALCLKTVPDKEYAELAPKDNLELNGELLTLPMSVKAISMCE